MRRHFILGLSLIVLSAPSLADESAQAAPDMQTLYDDAIRSMNARDYEKACPMIERVTQMAPDGLGAKFTLAECWEEQGKLANAYATFVIVEKIAREKGQNERSQKAAARADALRPKLVRITFTELQSLGSEQDLHVEIDGVRIESSELAEPRYVDAGTHHIVAFVKDAQRHESTIDIAAGADAEISLQELVTPPTRQPNADASTPSDSWGTSATTVPTWDGESNLSKQAPKQGFPVWQVALGGLGLAAIGIGVGFKLDSVAAEKKLIDNCGSDLVCPRNSWYTPFDDNDRKNRSFGVFLGMTAVGAIALGASTVGLIQWQKAKHPTTGQIIVQPTFSTAHGGVVFSGSF